LKITEKPAVRDRVNKAVSELDDTIKVIRSTIFALSEHATMGEQQGLRAKVLQVCQDSTEALGFSPAVRFTGPVDFEVSEQATEQALAVAREALSNVARHAKASKAEVDVTTAEGFLTLRIVDNGVGIPKEGRRSGLANLSDRAAALGGDFTAGPAEGGGAALVWRVPLED
jgi:signal transduction histidine kinase